MLLLFIKLSKTLKPLGLFVFVLYFRNILFEERNPREGIDKNSADKGSHWPIVLGN